MKVVDLDDGHTYCKITKSTKEIAKFCYESWFLPYISGKITEGQQLSFVELSDIGKVLQYGDTYTEFDFHNTIVQHTIANNSVQYTGNAIGEYKTTHLFVGNQYSLNESWTTLHIMAHANPLTARVLMQDFSNNGPTKQHYEKLGMHKGIQTMNFVCALYQMVCNHGFGLKEWQMLLEEKAMEIKPPKPYIGIVKSQQPLPNAFGIKEGACR